MDQNPETPISSTEPEVPAAEEVIDVQATQVGEPVSVPLDSPSFTEASYSTTPKKNSNGWIIAIVVLVVLCCCCLILFVPLVFAWNVLWGVLGSVYQVIVDILNSIFSGAIRFY